MKKKVGFCNEMDGYRTGSVWKGVLYIGGCAIHDLSDVEIKEVNVKTLKVHRIKKGGVVDRQGEIMELEKRNDCLAIVRDKYDYKYTAVLCETFYLASSIGLKVLNTVITQEEKTTAKSVAGKGITKKMWVITGKLP